MGLTDEQLKSEKLTTEQMKAVRCIDRDLEIVAVAGAGKTKTITLRIINLIASGVDPENIVAITFTKKAAAEMKSRIYAAGQRLLGSNKGFAGMFIGTIDSFCLRMLQDNVPEFNKFSVLDEVQSRIAIERFRFDNNGQDIGYSGSLIDKANEYYKQNITYSKRLSYYLEMVSILNTSWFDKQHRENWSDQVLTRLEKYTNVLYKNKCFDYSTIIRRMLEMLDPESDTNEGQMDPVARKIFDKVKYLTIDEYQDSNPSQEKLVELFKNYGNANICVVGDADQTIYQFRGSDERNILNFSRKYNAQTCFLVEDFRSTEAVIDIADAVIRNNHGDEEDYREMTRGHIDDYALEYEEGDTVWKKAENYDEESDFIVARIEELRELGIPYSEMAVLFKQRAYIYFGKTTVDMQQTLAAKLRERDIPYSVEGMNDLHSTVEYAAARAIFIYIRDRYLKKDVDADGNTSYSFYSSVELPEENEQRQTLKEAWEKIGEEYDNPALIIGLERALNYLDGIAWSEKKFGHELNMQEIYQEFLGYLHLLEMDDDDDKEQVMYNLGKFSKVIADFEQMYFKSRPTRKIDGFCSHLVWVAEGLYPEGREDNSYIRTDAVRLMTIHQSKGLEFAAVFIPGMCRGNYNWKDFDRCAKIYSGIDAICNYAGGTGLYNDNVAESWIPNYHVYRENRNTYPDTRKLVYVAITRAKKYLFMTYSTHYNAYDRYGHPIIEYPTCFLEEAMASSYLKEYSPDMSYTSDHLPIMNMDPLPIVLNFSLLSNYFDCPYRFKLSNYYSFVQPFKDVQGYGKVLHEIMMHIHRAWLDGERPDEAAVDRIAEDALYLPFANDVQIRNALQKAKECAHAYVAQNVAEADKLEAAEMEINIEMGQGVSVNGRIDLVKSVAEDGSEKVSIVDLKSAGKDAEQCLQADQLKIYAIGYEEKMGKKADYLEIYNLDHPDGSRNEREAVDRKVLEDAKAKIINAADNIRNDVLPKCKGEGCKDCYMKGLCH